MQSSSSVVGGSRTILLFKGQARRRGFEERNGADEVIGSFALEQTWILLAVSLDAFAEPSTVLKLRRAQISDGQYC